MDVLMDMCMALLGVYVKVTIRSIAIVILLSHHD
jgi:hypothetical protein